MKQEIRTVKYDSELKVEAYHFQGIMQKFPNHFHQYYVIGFIEKGQRVLSCKNKSYTIEQGDLLLFNPRDNHTCEQIDGKTLDYRCINIQPEIMSKAVSEITEKEYLPYFTPQVVFHSELVAVLRELHQIIMDQEKDFRKEEIFFFLLEQLIEEYTEQAITTEKAGQSTEASAICEFLENHYMENSYLETIRIDNAKKMLEKGILPIDVALQTGFTDQSHFSNFFKKFIGLTPKQYMNIFKEFKE